jgi:hypothetical protein
MAQPQDPNTFIAAAADPALAKYAQQLSTVPANTRLVVIEVNESVFTTNLSTVTYANTNTITNSPGGSATQLQYNNGTDFSGSSKLTFDAASGNLTVLGNLAATSFTGTFTGLGNLAVLNKDGNAANVLHGNGVFASVGAASLTGDAGNLSNIAGGNVVGTVGSATVAASANAVAGANVSGFVANANVANTAFAVAAGNVSGLGNIAVVNLDGNVANLITGTGTFVAIPSLTLTGDAGNLSNIAGGNVVGAVGSAALAGSVTTNAQANITSVGTLSSLGVTANATANNFVATFMTRTTPTTLELLGSATTAGAGARAWVTNSDATLASGNLLTICANTGSGAASVPVFSDGTNWLIG